MSIHVDFQDNSNEVKSDLKSALNVALDAVGFVAESNVKLLTPVDTGRLRGSISHFVDDNIVVIGTNVEYAKYVETNDRARHINGQSHFLRDGVTGHISEYEQIIKQTLTR